MYNMELNSPSYEYAFYASTFADSGVGSRSKDPSSPTKHSDKALPPTPSASKFSSNIPKSPKAIRNSSIPSESVSDPALDNLLYRGSSQKIAQLTGLTSAPKPNSLAKSHKILQLTGYDLGITNVQNSPKKLHDTISLASSGSPDSRYSYHSEPAPNEIRNLSISQEWRSWAPQNSPLSPTELKGPFYLQSTMYNIGSSGNPDTPTSAYTTTTYEPRSSFYIDEHDNLSEGSHPFKQNSHLDSRLVMSLDDLVADDDDNVDREALPEEIWQQTSSNNHDKEEDIEPRQRVPRYTIYSPYDADYEDNKVASPFQAPPYDGDDGLRPAPLILPLRQRALETETERSESRFSDHSSDVNKSGFVAQMRDSVVSHVRSLSSSLRPSTRPSLIFRQKMDNRSLRDVSPRASKRKRRFSSGKHPLKSPFPFPSPLHKSQRMVSPIPESPSAGIGRKMSDAFRSIAPSRKSSIVPPENIIHDHARSANGPDTPMPTKTGFMSSISPTEILQKGAGHVQDAIAKATKSKEEKRRDEIRKNIKVIGAADQSPNGLVTRWV